MADKHYNISKDIKKWLCSRSFDNIEKYAIVSEEGKILHSGIGTNNGIRYKEPNYYYRLVHTHPKKLELPGGYGSVTISNSALSTDDIVVPVDNENFPAFMDNMNMLSSTVAFKKKNGVIEVTTMTKVNKFHPSDNYIDDIQDGITKEVSKIKDNSNVKESAQKWMDSRQEAVRRVLTDVNSKYKEEQVVVKTDTIHCFK